MYIIIIETPTIFNVDHNENFTLQINYVCINEVMNSRYWRNVALSILSIKQYYMQGTNNYSCEMNS